MKMLSVASGSSGNCIAVCSDNTLVLVDTGISRKRIEEGLNKHDLTLKDASAILVTHEHSDHISGLGVVSRKDNIPIYSSKGTIDSILENDSIGKVDKDLFNYINTDETFNVGDLLINPFRISHDAAEPVAYRVYKGDKSVAIATDMGTFTDYTVDNLRNVNALLIEANHDVRMLQTGPYPYYLKQRILSDRGHLSNERCGELLSKILHDDLKKVYLGHLSKENNYDRLAYEAVRMEIKMSDNGYLADDFDIQVAKRTEPSTYIEI
ncbi:MAG: MBL fold metallo-hydrolase [Lachnospiraceae bacterium]|nr:MBL fold metallo-hydrolase [Lachnospiraceae bacterium]